MIGEGGLCCELCLLSRTDSNSRDTLVPPAKMAGAVGWVRRTLTIMSVRVSGVLQLSVWASVVSDDAQVLRDWLLRVGFTEDLMIPGEGMHAIHHCQLDWPEGGRILLSSTGERPTPCRPGTASLHVVTADPDAVLARVIALEARVVHEIVDQTDYPSRDFTVADPDGNHWTFATFAG